MSLFLCFGSWGWRFHKSCDALKTPHPPSDNFVMFLEWWLCDVLLERWIQDCQTAKQWWLSEFPRYLLLQPKIPEALRNKLLYNPRNLQIANKHILLTTPQGGSIRTWTRFQMWSAFLLSAWLCCLWYVSYTQELFPSPHSLIHRSQTKSWLLQDKAILFIKIPETCLNLFGSHCTKSHEPRGAGG